MLLVWLALSLSLCVYICLFISDQIYNSTEVMDNSSCPFVLVEGGNTTVTTPSAPLVSCHTSDGRPVLLISGQRTLGEYQVRI